MAYGDVDVDVDVDATYVDVRSPCRVGSGEDAAGDELRAELRNGYLTYGYCTAQSGPLLG